MVLLGGCVAGKYFLVDFKYANIPGFIAPYVGAPYGLIEHENVFQPQDAKELFNHRHSLLRSVTDRTFESLKERFPILMSAPSYPLPTQVVFFVFVSFLFLTTSTENMLGDR